MWLPTAFYERAPQYWLLLGLAFGLAGAYLGIKIHPLLMYLGLVIGAACCGWSLRIFLQRSARDPQIETDPGLDQTCELNYRPDDS